MANSLYDIMAALATEQPAAAVDMIHAELGNRVEQRIAQAALDYRYSTSSTAASGEDNGSE